MMSMLTSFSIPRNLRFRVPKDFEGPSWALGEDSWDLIHIRQGCGSVSSWPELYQKIFRCVVLPQDPKSFQLMRSQSSEARDWLP